MEKYSHEWLLRQLQGQNLNIVETIYYARDKIRLWIETNTEGKIQRNQEYREQYHAENDLEYILENYLNRGIQQISVVYKNAKHERLSINEIQNTKAFRWILQYIQPVQGSLSSAVYSINLSFYDECYHTKIERAGKKQNKRGGIQYKITDFAKLIIAKLEKKFQKMVIILELDFVIGENEKVYLQYWSKWYMADATSLERIPLKHKNDLLKLERLGLVSTDRLHKGVGVCKGIGSRFYENNLATKSMGNLLKVDPPTMAGSSQLRGSSNKRGAMLRLDTPENQQESANSSDQESPPLEPLSILKQTQSSLGKSVTSSPSPKGQVQLHPVLSLSPKRSVITESNSPRAGNGFRFNEHFKEMLYRDAERNRRKVNAKRKIKTTKKIKNPLVAQLVLNGLQTIAPRNLVPRRMTRYGPFIDGLVTQPTVLDVLEPTPKVMNKAPRFNDVVVPPSLIPKSPKTLTAVITKAKSRSPQALRPIPQEKPILKKVQSQTSLPRSETEKRRRVFDVDPLLTKRLKYVSQKQTIDSTESGLKSLSISPKCTLPSLTLQDPYTVSASEYKNSFKSIQSKTVRNLINIDKNIISGDYSNLNSDLLITK